LLCACGRHIIEECRRCMHVLTTARRPLLFAGVNAAEECRGCMEKSQFIEVLCRHIQA
jgi:hypothetical protein